jgi:uncharacterized membrane protein YgcG
MSEQEIEVTEEVSEDEMHELHEEEAEESSAGPSAVIAASGANLDANTVNVDTFETLVLDKETVDEVKRCWYGYIDGCASREAAGAAIYSALFDSAPSLQGLFKTPRAVMAMRFMNGISSMVEVLGDPAKLKIAVETLGFQHLDLEVTVPRVVIFRDAIVDLLVLELGSKMSTLGQNSLSAFLGYVGGAYIYIRKNYAERIRIIQKSWAIANNKTEEELVEDGLAIHDEHADAKDEEEGFKQEGKSEARSSGEANTKNAMVTKVPTTFSEMFMFNSAVMGYGNDMWMSEVLESFDAIVSNVANSYRLQEECDVLSLRLAKCRGTINLPQYKAVMLASLRSLVPKEWNSAYEVAWGWLWENVERMLKALLGRPAVMEQNLTRFLSSLDETTQDKIRRMVYATFFEVAPAGQDFFKQSTTRLHFIADKILEMTVDLFREPRRMCDDISALGLRHVGYAPPTELFGPFVSSCIQVIRILTQDEKLEDAFSWSLGLISRMLVRTILEGSTIVMKAINVNSGRQIRSAIGCAARSKRALWMLNITVGTQSISPLMWSIESGALDATEAIVKDLLTIRADRDRYYYAAEDLFSRHPDIVFQLCQNARKITWPLLDGLLWRSRITENGKRRVNYYVKYILVGEDSKINEAMSWIQDLGDPKLVCHPVLVFLADTVWNGAVYFTFITCKAWLVFTLLCFLTAQSILSMWGWNQEGMATGNAARQAQLALRLFVYIFCMGQLAIYHGKCCIQAYARKETFKVYCLQIPEYLKALQEWISLFQCISLVIMMCTCPKLYCIKHWAANDADFAVHGILNDFCDETEQIRVEYSILSVIVMLIFFIRMSDFVVMNNTMSAYLIMAFHCLQEVFLFLAALGFVIFAFAASTLALFETNPNFKDIPRAALSYLEMAFALFDPTAYQKVTDTVLIFILLILFQICIFVFLLNLLIAQLCSTHQSMYEDIIGYARMQRILTIYATMPYVPVPTWMKWLDSLMLDQKLEFGVGDIGLAGGIQIYEPANLNPTIVDSIKRVGGSTAPGAPWPPEDDDEGEGEGVARIEKMVTRMAQTLERRHGKKGKGGGSSMGVSGVGGSSAVSGESGGGSGASMGSQ